MGNLVLYCCQAANIGSIGSLSSCQLQADSLEVPAASR